MPPFSASDLLLNEGRIYHLNISAEQLYENIILVGDPGRVPMISKKFDSLEHEVQNREFVTHSGKYKGTGITALSTGIGTDNIDIVLNEIDALLNIDADTREAKQQAKSARLVRIGTCGALQENIAPGERVVSSFVAGFDNLHAYYNWKQYDQEAFVQKAVHKHLKEHKVKLKPYILQSTSVLDQLLPSTWKRGLTATAPGFYGPQMRQLRAQLKYENFNEVLSSFKKGGLQFMNFEMESSAIYMLSRMLDHQCVTVNLVLANRMRQEVLSDYHEKMDKLIGEVLDVMSTIN